VLGAKVKESGTFLNHSLGFLFRLPGRLHEAYLFIVQKSALLCAVICVYMGKTVAEIPEFGSGF
jgi:hypothetical protein